MSGREVTCVASLSLPPSDQPTTYKIYTTKFDTIIDAADLDDILGRPSARDRGLVEEAWHEVQTGLLPWRTRLHIAAAERSASIRQSLSDDQRRDTVVSLLLDQSGSMRGQKILFAAATTDVVQEFLLTLGISCEVLGFTTSRWKGGRSRQRWRWRFRPKNPGRLNDILHIVYRNAGDQRASAGNWLYRQMLRPDLTKENIDGEAIEWAVGRLCSLPHKRKILIVLSDGAPVDDSTLRENGPTFLADHLESVVNRVTDEGDVQLAAFGIGYAAHSFYPTADHVSAPDELGIGLVAMIEKMLTRSFDCGDLRQ